MKNSIVVKGAREHNLKNIDFELPKYKLIVITGVSGSGKSSIAFDTIYAEGQRKYVESLDAYARQFLHLMPKPDVDVIEGLSPAIAIQQKTTSNNPRSTVGTVTEIYDYLRLLYARIGVPYSPATGKPIKAQTISQMVDHILKEFMGKKILVLAPIIKGRKGEHKKEINNLKAAGFTRVMLNNEMYEIEDLPNLDKNKNHNLDLVVDRIVLEGDINLRLTQSLEIALNTGEGGVVYIEVLGEGEENERHVLSSKFSCPISGFSLDELEPRLFSFNSPHGACSTCDGIGSKRVFTPVALVYNPEAPLLNGALHNLTPDDKFGMSILLQSMKVDPRTPFNKLPQQIQEAIYYGFDYDMPADGRKNVKKHFTGIAVFARMAYENTGYSVHTEDILCASCGGYRLKPEALSVKILGKHIGEFTELSIEEADDFIKELPQQISKKDLDIGERVIKEISERLGFLNRVGLGYLNLSRQSGTLSGGESQRIRLASQIGSGLTGVLYVLDEPSIGLHQKDNDRLLETLKHLRDLGNTVIVVEHDEDAMNTADYLVDVGIGAGVNGGRIISAGTVAEVKKSKDSLTAKYLSGRSSIAIPKTRRKWDKSLKLHGAKLNNLKNVSAEFPLSVLTCVTGVSGGGKSSLVIGTLFMELHRKLNYTKSRDLGVNLEGIDYIDKVIDIDQSPIGKTPRSNPATYIGLFTPIREWFAGLPEARARGYQIGRFSFNVRGGRCEACEGDGVKKVEMHFLPDVYVTCDECKGKRYNRETLEVKYKGKSVSDVLAMTVDEGIEFFSQIRPIKDRLQVLQDVGLGYIQIGQSANTLSGGEAQRVKLAKELSKRSTGKTVYILDEPTTGLHFEDIKKLLSILDMLVNQGNTVIVIEHNLDVIKTADWIIDMGPEGGERGGYVVKVGTPEEVAKDSKNPTGYYLKRVMKK